MSTVPPPGPHGGDGAAIARALGLDPDDLLDLSTTLNPLAPDPDPILRRHLPALRRYPNAEPATEALAEGIGVPADRLLLTNGGAEAIALVGAVLGGRVDEPDFGAYPRGPAVRPVPGLTPDRPPRWRSNPHSPGGTVELEAGPRDGLTVWDEAFWPLATGTWSRRDDRRGDVVVGSLTKLLGRPGLRAGHLIVPDDDLGRELLDRIIEHRAGWPVGGLVCAALPELLSTVDLPAWRDALGVLRDQLADALARLGFTVDATGPTWLLVRGAHLRDALAHRGVVVRDTTSFGLPDTVRLGLPAPADLDRVVDAFAAVGPPSGPTDHTRI